MKLVLATPLYPPEAGGPATYAKILEEELPKHDIEVVTVKFREVRHLPPLIRHIAYFFNVLKETKGAKAILVQDTVSVGLPSALASIVSGVPLIVRVPGDYAWEQSTQRYGVTDLIDDFQTKKYGSKVETLRSIQRFVVRHAQKVIVPSHYMSKIVSQWIEHKERVTVIHNSVSIEKIGIAPQKLQELPRPIVVTVGRLVPWKRIDDIMSAVTNTQAKSLVIAGDGPEREALEAHSRKIFPNTYFTGALPHADVLATIKASDVFVLNSTYEGFSHLLIEACLLGVPVVASDIEANKELLSQTANELVASGSPERLSEGIERSLKKAKQENVAELSKRFSPYIMGEKVANIIHSLP